METLAIARIWAAAAWADGVLHQTEAAALRRFLEAATELDAAERAAAEQLFEGPPVISIEAEVAKLSEESKEGVYRAVTGIMWLDGKLVEDELSFVARLRDQLGLPAALIARIEQEQAKR